MRSMCRLSVVLSLIAVIGALLAAPAIANDLEADGETAVEINETVGFEEELSRAIARVERADGSVDTIECEVVSQVRLECLDSAGAGMVGILNLSAPIEPQSASGTNGRVKISVTGSGLQVTNWQTRARQYRSDGCIDHDAYFYAKPPWSSSYNFVTAILYYGPCVSVPWYASSIDWWTYGNHGQNGSYVNGTKLCNAWSPNLPLWGFPCITVHS